MSPGNEHNEISAERHDDLPRKSIDLMMRNIQYQKGQAIGLGLVLCGAALLAWLTMLELGQRIHDQSSLHRATDAAAYSAALMHARALNMHAYLNRAQLGHQLGMAHLIAVATASRYSAQLAIQARLRHPPPSLIGAFFGPQHATAYVAALRSGIGEQHSQHTFQHAFLRHERQVHQVLDQVRQLQLKNFERQREQAIHRMLIANVGHSGDAKKGDSLEQLGLSVSIILDESKGFVVQQSANDALWRDFLTQVMSQHGFLSERRKTQRNVWLVNPRCPLKRHELRRRGRLQLGPDGQWLSDDSLSFHALRHNKLIGCYQREYPMGWAVLETNGTQHANQDQTAEIPDLSKQAFWRWARMQRRGDWNIFNGRQNPLAQRYGQHARVEWASKGLGRYAQVAQGRERAPIRVALRVKQSIKSGQDIHSLATAQTYFDHPDIKKDRQANLFEPYWRATLIPNIRPK